MKRGSDLLTVNEAAREKGVHVKSVYRAIKEGRLKAQKRDHTRLILRRELDAWPALGHRPKRGAARRAARARQEKSQE